MSALVELQEQVRSARAAGRPLCIVGGDSKRHIGREQAGDPIDMSTYSGVVDYQPSELVITVRAGTTVSDLQEVLAEGDQVLAGEPPEFGGKATVGGTLACNLAGPARPWQGSIRDHVLGVRIINGRGEHLRFGGQVMKNVAGYDVSRLMAGAMGTLGILTEVTLKVMPKPQATMTVSRTAEAGDALQFMNALARKPFPLSGACWHEGQLHVRLAGANSVVDMVSKDIGGSPLPDNAGFWNELRDMQLPFFTDANELWCISLRSTVEHVMPDEHWLIDWRGARRWLAGASDPESLYKLVDEAGGEAWQLRGARNGADVFPDRSDAYRKMLLRLKQALDPAGILNPGRLYSWL